MTLSVVTINLNNCAGLRRTLSSLKAQSCKEFELIVVDGGSTDGSMEVCDQYEGLIASRISKPDDGIYEAWNRGIDLAHGSLICLLNSGDEYHPEVIATLKKEFEKSQQNCPVFCGITLVVREGSIVKTIPNRLRRNLIFGLGIAHPSIVVPRWVYDKIGHYEKLAIASDSQFILRCLRADVPFKSTEFMVYMDGGGISQRSAVKAFAEYIQSLVSLGFCGRVSGRLALAGYAAYRVVLGAGCFAAVRNFSANLHHVGIRILNVYQAVCFFRPLRHWALRSLGFRIHRSAFVSPAVAFYRTGNLIVGEASVINRGVLIDNRATIAVGAGCSISHSVQLITAGHDIDSPYFEYFSRPIKIGDHVAIFARSVVLPGTELRNGVVVLPGSVISGDTVENGIYGGVPARKLRQRHSNPRHRFTYHRPFAL